MTYERAKALAMEWLSRPRYFVVEGSRLNTTANVYRVRGHFVTHYNFKDKSWWPARSVLQGERWDRIGEQVTEWRAAEVIRHFQALHDFIESYDTPPGKKANA